MDDAVLNFRFGEQCFNGSGKPAQTNTDGDIYDLFHDFHDPPLTVDMMVEGNHENHCVYALQRSLLPFFHYGKPLCYSAYSRVGHLCAVDIPNMSLNIRCAHALDVHGQDLFLDVLTDAGLVFLQHLRLKFALTIPGHGYLHIAEAGAQPFAAVPVPAVVRVLVFIVILAVAQFAVQLRIEAVFHEFGNRFLEQTLSVVHTAYVRWLRQFTDLGSAFIFFWSEFPSCHSDISNMMLLFYTTLEGYTKYGMVSFLNTVLAPF